MNKVLKKYQKVRNSGLKSRDFWLWFIGTILNKLKNRIYTYLVIDTDLAMACSANKVKLKLVKKYKKKDQLNMQNIAEDASESFPKIVWWCWLQGEDEAPELAKICLASIRKNFEGYDIRVVTKDNIEEYVEIPKSIYKKLDAGIISGAFFSDILRLNLLAKHGGIWIDSTVYCSDDKLISKIEENDLFMYKNVLSTNSKIIQMSSWLIAARRGNRYLNHAASLLTDYAVNMHYLEDYFVCHIILSILADEYSIWDNMMLYNNTDPHMLSQVINTPFSIAQYNEIINRSSFHKLNRHESTESKEYTYYDFIKDAVNE